MTRNRDGTLIFEPNFDSIVVSFERTLPYPPKRVWERLVDRAHLHEWLTSEPGGHIRHREGVRSCYPRSMGMAARWPGAWTGWMGARA